MAASFSEALPPGPMVSRSGRKATELDFLHQRLHQKGAFTPPDTIVLHLYGRYCNANKFAGALDLSPDHVKKDFSIDENRILVRGFSMGAACWQFATITRLAAAAPGAGFSETKEFLEFFSKEELKPYWWETRLWNLYDATVYAETSSLPHRRLQWSGGSTKAGCGYRPATWSVRA